jgi:hypothetical protein
MSRIVSSLPGRIRLRDSALRQPDRLERLCAMLSAMEGVLSVDGNVKAGSLVLRFEAKGRDVEAMEAAVEAAADAEFARPRPGLKPSTRVRLNRYAKRGMAVSLGASLVLAAAGYKRWHILTGGAFVACLAVHLAVHRRHLFR